MRVLVTAGGTREYIDPVRYITNASSGRMGYALARAAHEAGHETTLITAPTTLHPPGDITVIDVQTAHDMYLAVKERFQQCDVLVMAAAVSDYTVAQPMARKLQKRDTTFTLRLEPTVDILQWAGAEKQRLDRRKEDRRQSTEDGVPNTEDRRQKTPDRRQRPFGRGPMVVGFALEDEDLQTRAEAKLRQKHLDMIVANLVTAIGAIETELHIKTPDTPWRVLPTSSKLAQARRIISMIEAMIAL